LRNRRQYSASEISACVEGLIGVLVFDLAREGALLESTGDMDALRRAGNIFLEVV
jgi:hypothetical protein